MLRAQDWGPGEFLTMHTIAQRGLLCFQEARYFGGGGGNEGQDASGEHFSRRLTFATLRPAVCRASVSMAKAANPLAISNESCRRSQKIWRWKITRGVATSVEPRQLGVEPTLN